MGRIDGKARTRGTPERVTGVGGSTDLPTYRLVQSNQLFTRSRKLGLGQVLHFVGNFVSATGKSISVSVELNYMLSISTALSNKDLAAVASGIARASGLLLN